MLEMSNNLLNKILAGGVVIGSIASVISNQILYSIVPLSALGLNNFRRRNFIEIESALVVNLREDFSKIIEQKSQALTKELKQLEQSLQIIQQNQVNFQQHLQKKENIIKTKEKDIKQQQEWEKCLLEDNENLNDIKSQLELRNLELEEELEQLKQKLQKLSQQLNSDSITSNYQQDEGNLIDLSTGKSSILREVDEQISNLF